MEFEFINTSSDYLQHVMSLGKKNSSTLGFMPEGGFIEHARKKYILIAKEDEKLLGYILFRIAVKTNILSITHLCIDESYRGKKVAVNLIDTLKTKYRDSLAGILLSCREDYKRPCELWQKNGFVAKNKIRSRSQEVHYLIKWWYSFNQVDLFSFEENTTKRGVLMDMNILIKLRENKEDKNHLEVQSLLADWLVDKVEYFFAQEFYNEIIRDENIDRVKETKSFVENNFKEAIANREESKEIYIEINKFFKNNKINDNSDIKQLSDCIAANIKYFITLDNYILSSRNKIEESYDIIILSPEEFILRIDMLLDDSNYQPKILAGANHTTNRIESKDLNFYLDKFLKSDRAETKTDFKKEVNSVIQNITIGNIQTVENHNKEAIAFWGYILTENAIHVKFIRTLHDNLEVTLFTQLVFEIINITISSKKNVIEIKDDFFCCNKIQILNDFGFVKLASIWKKITINDLIHSRELPTKYPYIYDYIEKEKLDILLSESNEEKRRNNLYKLERILFPIKFEDLDIACYIIPIKRYWAGQLFDKYNTNKDLFGANPNKIWNRENIYYRSIKPVDEQYPARILWYVSAHKNQDRQKAILAVSYLDDVSVDLVKKQFKKFKKYGIYEWSNIYELAGSDDTKKVKAIKFSDTEVFIKEINFDKITLILQNNNQKRNTFASPVKVSNGVFNDIYKFSLIDNV